MKISAMSTLWMLLWFASLPLFNARIDRSLHILHVGKMESRFTGIFPTLGPCERTLTCYGGFPRISAIAKSLRSKNLDTTILLNTGDNFRAGAFTIKFGADVLLEFLNDIEFDAIALGNSDFQFRFDELLKFIKQTDAPIVCANMIMMNGIQFSRGEMEEYIIVNKSKIRVGIVGYAAHAAVSDDQIGKVRLLGVIESVRRAARAAREEGAQAVVVIGSSGYEQDRMIAELIEEVDIVIGADSKTFLYSGASKNREGVTAYPYPALIRQKSGKAVVVAHSFTSTKYFGHLNVLFDYNYKVLGASGNPIIMTPNTTNDPASMAILNKWLGQLNDTIPIEDVITVFKSNAFTNTCTYEECALGNMVSDAMADYACQSQNVSKGCVIALINAGTMSGNLPSGEVTSLEIAEVFPYNNTLVVLKVRGSTLLEILETSVRYFSKDTITNFGFLQVSGICVTYNVSASPGNRVLQARAKVGGSTDFFEISKESRYSIVISQYIFEGGDNYTMFRKKSRFRYKYLRKRS